MDFADSRIVLASSDPGVQGLIDNTTNHVHGGYTRHFNQGEDFFITFPEAIMVPSLPIHHPVSELAPTKIYKAGIHRLVEGILSQAPQLFQGLRYFFDPRDHLRPSFYKLYRIADQHYLYLLKLDLTYHPGRHETITPGTNDTSPEYRSRSIIMEADMIPITSVETGEKGSRVLTVHQSISDTWIGETGRGYFVQGIWLDRELSKFFSKLFLPRGKRTYPYYPITCKYRSICLTVIHLDPEGRKRFLPILHQARGFLLNNIAVIENSLRSQEFSESLPAFTKLFDTIPDQLRAGFAGISVNPYLNQQEMREYEIVEQSG